MLNQFMKEGLVIIPKILLTKFKQLNISSEALVLLLGLVSLEQNRQEPIDLEHVKALLSWTIEEIYASLSELMDAKLIEFEWLKENSGKQQESISLKPLFHRLESFYQVVEPKQLEEDYTLVQLFEQEFGRQLSPIELGTISKWRTEDQMSDDLIQLALTQAVLNQAFSFKYIDKIILTWIKRNIRTVEEAKRDIDSFNQHKSQREQMDEPVDLSGFKLPNINW